jgi:serine/threonine-protein kinase
MIDALAELEEDWHARQAAECHLEEAHSQAAGETMPNLRHTPLRTGVRQAAPFEFLDPLFRPKNYWTSDFVAHPMGILDRSSSLVWRKRISRYPMTWNEAGPFLDELNQQHREHASWRLPTVEELATLLRPKVRIEDFCSPTWFDQGKAWLWTADRRSYTTAWFVDVAHGAVLWQDFTCHFHVMAVRNP